MASPLGLLAGLGGATSVAQQLLVWGVLNQLVGTLTTSLQRSIETRVNANDPNAPLSPDALALAVLKGILAESEAAPEAAKSGTNADRFHTLVLEAGDAPGPDALAEALRRQIIVEGAASRDDTSFEAGIRESRLRDKWASVVKALDKRLPGIEAAVDAEVRTMRFGDEPRKLFELFGGDPAHYDLLRDLAGEGITPNEAASAAFREIIAWTGQGADKTSFEQAVAESRFKNKWTDIIRAIAEYIPPPRTITAMLREGSITDDRARTLLLHYGVNPQELDAYLSKAKKTGVQRAHEITETEIIRLYTERAFDADVAKKHLTDIGYSDTDANLIIVAADLDYQSKLATATIAVIKNLYLHRHIDANGAITRLQAAGVKADYRDALLSLWDLEIEAGVKSLTVKQILDFQATGLLSIDDARTKLRQAGYSNADTELILAFANPATDVPAGVAAGQNNPGP